MDQYRYDNLFAMGTRPRSRLAGAGYVRLHRIGALGIAALCTFAVTTTVYFFYRVDLWNPEAPVLSTLLVIAEVFGTVTLLLHAFSTWTLVERHAPPPPPDFEADIFITTWNEAPEILRHTLLAAKHVTHVRDIWLLDDGCRAEMRALAQELGVRYIAREDRSHAKAGNLNNALKYSNAPFIAIFDCDHAPAPDFLERTLGYFMDSRVGFVQTPQDFYNIDSFQHRGSAKTREAWHEQTLFYRVIQAGKDRWNATFFCGSCAIMRRVALEDIGGIATGTITEDMHTSIRMHKNGWSAVYHAEALAFGLSPANLEQYETQRLRWGRGAMQVWAKEGFLFRGRLTLAQRIAYFTSTITYFEGWQKAIIYLLPAVVLLTGSMPIIWTGWQFIGVFLLWFLSGMLVNEIFSRGYAKTIWMEEYNFLRFFTFMKATLALVIPINWRFSVTPKTMSSQTGIPVRLWPQALVALGAIAAILIGSYRYHMHHHLPEGAFIANLVWLTLNAALFLKALIFATGRLRQRRSTHRFPIPLLTRIQTKDGTRFVVAQDVSSYGLSLAVGADIPEMDVIEGSLILPNKSLNFSGKVVRSDQRDNNGNRILAVHLQWSNAGDADILNSCLYGNSLQWDVNGWSEVRRASLRGLWDRKAQPVLPWRAGIIESDNAAGTPCLMREEAGSWRVLSYAPLPETEDLTLSSDGKRLGADLGTAGYRQYMIGGAPVHMVVLADHKTNRTVFHREPAWITETA